MVNLREKFKQRPLLWLGVVVVMILTAAAVHAALPSISLNSPASFPVDI